MIPVAPARFSRGISSRSCFSSRITSIATHAGSFSCDTVGDFSARFEDRLQALSRVQDQIARNSATSVQLADLVKMEFEALGLLETGRVRVEGPDCRINSKQAETLALALHELGTNAIKYGAMATDKGRLSVSWICPDEGERWLQWLETGVVGLEPANTRRGYGRELIEVALPYALGAQTRLDFHEAGTVRCTITLPKEAP